MVYIVLRMLNESRPMYWYSLSAFLFVLSQLLYLLLGKVICKVHGLVAMLSLCHFVLWLPWVFDTLPFPCSCSCSLLMTCFVLPGILSLALSASSFVILSNWSCNLSFSCCTGFQLMGRCLLHCHHPRDSLHCCVVHGMEGYHRRSQYLSNSTTFFHELTFLVQILGTTMHMNKTDMTTTIRDVCHFVQEKNTKPQTFSSSIVYCNKKIASTPRLLQYMKVLT